MKWEQRFLGVDGNYGRLLLRLIILAESAFLLDAALRYGGLM